MTDKSFEITIGFQKNALDGRWYPIVDAMFLTKFGNWIKLPMLFDTGATPIILRPDHGNSFTPAGTRGLDTPGDETSRQVPTATGKMKVFDVEGDYTLYLDKLPPNPLYQGLLGRAPFSAFGFGFWERDHKLYVTLKP